MTSYSALAPVSAGIFALLNVAALTALAPGGVGDDVAQRCVTPDAGGTDTGYPFVLFEVHESIVHAFGTKPGLGQLPAIDLRVHVFSKFEGHSEGQAVIATVIQLLTANPPTVTGYASWAIFHDETVNLGDQIVAGVKVKELVALFRLYVEEGVGVVVDTPWIQDF